MLFAISMVALMQFGLYYWRAVLTSVAAQPIPTDILEAVQVEESNLTGSDFEKLASVLTLTPELQHSRAHLGFVPLYYKLVSKVSDLFGSLGPALASWSERERLLCARYAAVQIGHRLEANLAQAAAIRSC